MRNHITHPFRLAAVLAACALALGGCGGKKKDGPCTEASDCDNGFVCEPVQGGDNACFLPVSITGTVIDVETGAPVAGATVIALDVNGFARSDTVTTDASGNYVLPVSVQRDADGTPLTDTVTLRVAGEGYQLFPTAPRVALPIGLASGIMSDSGFTIDLPQTDVALYPTGVDPATVATISGRVDAEAPSGVLVVAVQNGVAVSSAISDADGSFVLFNVPRNVSTSVEGYRQGLNVVPSVVTATGETLDGVVLATDTTNLYTVNGTIQFRNAPGVTSTSVILVTRSTFDATVARGEAPPGLRAGNVSGPFSITGVAPGEYVALAAFENDNAVRDPDLCISGTDIVFIHVSDSGVITYDQGASLNVAGTPSFSVTSALAVTSPGMTGIDVLAANPTQLVWENDSSEEGYEVRIYDAFGDVIHEELNVPSVSGGSIVTYPIPNSVMFEAGQVYQFRAWSYSINNMGVRCLKSATEDLRGVFQVP